MEVYIGNAEGKGPAPASGPQEIALAWLRGNLLVILQIPELMSYVEHAM